MPETNKPVIECYGGGQPADLQPVRSISVESGMYSNLKELILNRDPKPFDPMHAESGETLVMTPDEYISDFTISRDSPIRYVSFRTNKGRATQGGMMHDGDNVAEKHNVKVLRMGWRAGATGGVEHITLEYEAGSQ